MAKITNILNGILGVGTNRRHLTAANQPKAPHTPVWEVRAKFDRQTKKVERPRVK